MRHAHTPRKLFLVVPLAVLFAGALLIAPGSVTPDLDALESPDCTCEGGNTTPPRWGKGNSCAASLADLDAQASADYQNEAPTTCPALCGPGGFGEGCDPQLIITGSCYWDPASQKYITDGHYRYGCLECP